MTVRGTIRGKCIEGLNLEEPLNQQDQKKLGRCVHKNMGGWKKCHKQCRQELKFAGPAWKLDKEQRGEIKQCVLDCTKANRAHEEFEDFMQI